MKIDMIWRADKVKKLVSKNGNEFFIQPVTLYPFSGGPLKFDVLSQDGEKRFEDTHETMRKGQIDLLSDRGDLKIAPASAGQPCSMGDYFASLSSGEILVVDLTAWPGEHRPAGEFDDRSWDEAWMQSVTVLNDKLVPTDLTLKTYHDFEADLLAPDIYRAEFVLTARKSKDRFYPSFKLQNIVPARQAVQAAS
jgi:hypothetical protein